MTTTWDLIEKSSTSLGGWQYNENNLTYNQAIDPDSGGTVNYNGFGNTATWSLLTKS